ncbi:nucleotidyl transferase AbiEii/AbiGii toxin family protein [Candidatus Roizmanbacteria bacterium]|nr:nucleotidyl transferase AbiEii/AbiGii toxin family protein [Candidatus Roizmanbacteria bacterium]
MLELNENQKKLIQLLSVSPLAKKFYLTGGTALSAFYLHHRLSIDLDFFCDQPFSYSELTIFLNTVEEKFNLQEVPAVKIFDRWQFTIEGKEPVKLEFVYFNHEKKRLKPLGKDMGIFIDSLDDIAANKTLAYFDRNEPKDLFDLYYLMGKSGFSVSQLLQMVKDKFGIRFSEFSFWSESTKSLKLLNSLEPLMIEKNPNTLIKKINHFFFEQGRKSLAKNLE